MTNFSKIHNNITNVIHKRQLNKLQKSWLNQKSYRDQNYEDAENCVELLNKSKLKNNSNNDNDEDTTNLISLKYKCFMNNIGLFYIEHFDYHFSSDISKIDLLKDENFNKEYQIEHQIEHLNYLLDL